MGMDINKWFFVVCFKRSMKCCRVEAEAALNFEFAHTQSTTIDIWIFLFVLIYLSIIYKNRQYPKLFYCSQSVGWLNLYPTATTTNDALFFTTLLSHKEREYKRKMELVEHSTLVTICWASYVITYKFASQSLIIIILWLILVNYSSLLSVGQ